MVVYGIGVGVPALSDLRLLPQESGGCGQCLEFHSVL